MADPGINPFPLLSSPTPTSSLIREAERLQQTQTTKNNIIPITQLQLPPSEFNITSSFEKEIQSINYRKAIKTTATQLPTINKASLLHRVRSAWETQQKEEAKRAHAWLAVSECLSAKLDEIRKRGDYKTANQIAKTLEPLLLSGLRGSQTPPQPYHELSPPPSPPTEDLIALTTTPPTAQLTTKTTYASAVKTNAVPPKPADKPTNNPVINKPAAARKKVPPRRDPAKDERLFLRLPQNHSWRTTPAVEVAKRIETEANLAPGGLKLVHPIPSGFALLPGDEATKQALLYSDLPWKIEAPTQWHRYVVQRIPRILNMLDSLREVTEDLLKEEITYQTGA